MEREIVREGEREREREREREGGREGGGREGERGRGRETLSFTFVCFFCYALCFLFVILANVITLHP